MPSSHEPFCLSLSVFVVGGWRARQMCCDSLSSVRAACVSLAMGRELYHIECQRERERERGGMFITLYCDNFHTAAPPDLENVLTTTNTLPHRSNRRLNLRLKTLPRHALRLSTSSTSRHLLRRPRRRDPCRLLGHLYPPLTRGSLTTSSIRSLNSTAVNLLLGSYRNSPQSAPPPHSVPSLSQERAYDFPRRPSSAHPACLVRGSYSPSSRRWLHTGSASHGIGRQGGSRTPTRPRSRRTVDATIARALRITACCNPM